MFLFGNIYIFFLFLSLSLICYYVNSECTDVLIKFINNEHIPVIKAKDARDIQKFFQCVTMSVSQRSVQTNPDRIEEEEIKQLFREEELDF